MTPWCKLDTLILSLLRKILDTRSKERLTIDGIIDHKWCHLQFNSKGKLLL